MTDDGPGVESLANLATISPSCHSAEVLQLWEAASDDAWAKSDDIEHSDL